MQIKNRLHALRASQSRTVLTGTAGKKREWIWKGVTGCTSIPQFLLESRRVNTAVSRVCFERLQCQIANKSFSSRTLRGCRLCQDAYVRRTGAAR